MSKSSQIVKQADSLNKLALASAEIHVPMLAKAENARRFIAVFGDACDHIAMHAKARGMDVHGLAVIMAAGRCMLPNSPEDFDRLFADEKAHDAEEKPADDQNGDQGGSQNGPQRQNGGQGGASDDPNAPPPPPPPPTADELAAKGIHPDGTPFTAKERKKAGLPPVEGQ